MEKNVLIEYITFTPRPEQLNESKFNQDKPLIVSGKIQAADKPNANLRIYTYDALNLQVQKYIDGPINERRSYGELDHPESSIINLKNASHIITRMWWEGKDLYGEFEILSTPSGNILKELFRKRCTVGVSSRALGSTMPIGEGIVQVGDDLDLICWDFVSNPSTYGAYVKPAGGINEGYNPSLQNTSNKYTNVSRMISDLICSQSGVCCLK